jgi:cystathionine beta-lyase/cystathionine gamma-synthase
MASFNASTLKAALPSILAAIPYEWRGTTFNNSNLLGRAQFCERVKALVNNKGVCINTEDLVALGNAEDYLRVSTNISCLLELVLATQFGFSIDQIFSFGSEVMPVMAVILTSTKPVHLYVGEGGKSTFSQDLLNAILTMGHNFQVHFTAPREHVGEDVVIVAVGNQLGTAQVPHFVDAFVHESVLYINKPEVVLPSRVLVIRKRLGTPMTTPAAERTLQTLAGVEVTADTRTADSAGLAEFYAHLQVLSGTAVDPTSNPVCFTAGLSAVASFYLSLIAQTGADVVMASTSYGGSSELTDICSRASNINKHTYDITGKNDIQLAIKATLDRLAGEPERLLPLTVLFVEIPTNPDMKIPDVTALVNMLLSYEGATGRKVLLLVDTTFAPGSKVLEKVHAIAPNLTALVFISMSKSVSRGYTTAGCIVAGPTPAAKQLLSMVAEMSVALDTFARRDQLVILVNNHAGVEERCANAYSVAVTVGTILCEAVRNHCNGYDMQLAFVTPESAAEGFSSSTFSFNLPAIAGLSEEANEALAQKFVDLLTADKDNFKPCVSFGQDNGLVYCTVPATSTQGAIKKEDKAKQAVGGVQLTRLSFPPTCNLEAICNVVTNAVGEIYRQN